MASIVKANANLTAGGLAVLKRTFSTDREGKLTYSADYVCLSQFTNSHARKFRTGATPPTPLPASIAALRIVEVPKLYDLQTDTINGLTYFRATYVAVGDSEASYSITESTDWRSFQGSVSRVIVTGPPGFLTDNPVTDTLSFDYISKTSTVTSQNRNAPQGPIGSVSGRYNERRTRTFAIGGGTIEGGRVPTGVQSVRTSQSTRNSDGTYTYSQTASGIYVQTSY